jgi:mono/diheme cytochrome c family protein
MIMSTNSPAKVRAKGWGWIPSAAALALILAPALISTTAHADDLKAAASNYTESCAGCHGPTGKGDGPKAAKLSVKVGDLSDCAKMSKVSDDVLFKVTKEGGPAANLNKAMAPFGDAFEDNDIKGLVAYIRSFCAK